TEASEAAPEGQPVISGVVPITYRTFDTETNSYVETPITEGFTITVPGSGRLDLQFGVDRSQMSDSSHDFYASFLRIRDSIDLSDVLLPITAQVSTPAGLWLGEVTVDSVDSTVIDSPGSTTSRDFPLRAIVHVDGGGVARLLSQVF